MAIQLMIPKGTAEVRAADLGVTEYEVRDIPARDEEYARLAEQYELFTFAQGQVVAEREKNGYHDSDFFATYRTAHGGFRELEYGTTRGWCYLNHSTIDATPEVRAEYVEFEKGCAALRAQWAAEQRAERLAQEAPELGVTVEALDRLENAYRGNLDVLDSIKRLLRTKKFRSAFRQSMAERVREWCAEASPKYDRPLSPKQSQYV